MTTTRKLIIIGGKGNGTVVASAVEDIIADGRNWEILGFLNDSHRPGESVDGYPVLGKPEDAESYSKKDCYFFYGLISAKMSVPRVKRLKTLGLPVQKFATLVHPTAHVSRNVQLGYGVGVMPFTYIGQNARLGNHILVHGHCYIARDTILEDYAYLAPRATLGAEAVMEEGAYLGTACSVLERVVVGAWSVVGMGANVLHHVSPYGKVVGNPARMIGTVSYHWTEDGTDVITKGD